MVTSPNVTVCHAPLPLGLGRPATTVVARAVDGSNQYAWSTAGATAKWLIYPGDTDPTINVNSPLPNSTFSKVIGATGYANDDTGVAKVELQVQNSGSQYMAVNGTFGATPTWVPAYVTNPNGGRTNFNYNTPVLPPGTYTMTLRSTDVNGQLQQVPTVVSNITVTN